MTLVFISCPNNEEDDKLSEIAKAMLKKRGWDPYRAIDDPRCHLSLEDKILPKLTKPTIVLGIITKCKSRLVTDELAFAQSNTIVVRLVEEEAKDIGGFTGWKEYIRFTRDSFEAAMEKAILAIENALEDTAGDTERLESVGVLQSSSQPDATMADAPQQYVQMLQPSIEEYVAASGPVPGWYPGLERYTVMAADDLSRMLTYGTTWALYHVKVDVNNRTVWLVLVVDTDTNFILSHRVSLDKPDVDCTSLVLQLAQIVAGHPSLIEGDLPPVLVKSFQNSPGSMVGKNTRPKYRQHDGSLTWFKKYLKAMLYKACIQSIGTGISSLRCNIGYEILNHNFLRQPYSEDIPAKRAGMDKDFEDVMAIYNHGLSGEKGFLVKLGSLIRDVDIDHSTKNGFVYVTIKPTVNKSVQHAIESILLECKFQPSWGSWSHRFASGRARLIGRKRIHPETEIETCNRCHNAAISMQEILLLHGFRHDKYSNTVWTQPSCRLCGHGPRDPDDTPMRKPPHRLRLYHASLDSFMSDD
ncbi:MAG: hypothetical protein MPJ08_02115 [Nitrosopumilus sp.]|nr:hypothetical protein [Nitrosopumilus sp.]